MLNYLNRKVFVSLIINASCSTYTILDMRIIYDLNNHKCRVS